MEGWGIFLSTELLGGLLASFTVAAPACLSQIADVSLSSEPGVRPEELWVYSQNKQQRTSLSGFSLLRGVA